ncbi:MAG: peptide deformylase [Elusimicrobia bacterium RIFOXYA2_FULL_58_8]|nr:MAG: peptide deformylase [Elusimicrobia bacterium RIFOXYA12_FULL_57_11]OGS13947.1 MAG: peptide deformylase [Elusimicrobia bacterium RIFOXYA2_FULL_58_8]
MAIRRICKYGEPILERKTRKVDFDAVKKTLPALLADMFETMEAVGGAGLAANQVGVDLRLAVISIKREDEPPVNIVILNPEITEKSGVSHEEEGCLSFPGLFAKVRRAAKVKVRALNEKGLPIEINAEGLFAKALQHEIDHLDGLVFVSRLPLMSRLKLKPALLGLKKKWKKMDESRLNKTDNAS